MLVANSSFNAPLAAALAVCAIALVAELSGILPAFRRRFHRKER